VDEVGCVWESWEVQGTNVCGVDDGAVGQCHGEAWEFFSYLVDVEEMGVVFEKMACAASVGDDGGIMVFWRGGTCGDNVC
jgi:hypothetical protein